MPETSIPSCSPLSLTVISGLPGSGKSTLARRLSAESGAFVVNRDEARRHFDFIDESELTLLLVRLSASFLRNGLSVIVDSPNLHARDPVRWTELATLAGAELRWIHLSTSTDECIRRDARRPVSVGADVIHLIATKSASQLGLLVRHCRETSYGK
jgi:predicted kinase